MSPQAAEDMQISPFDVRPDAHGIDAMRDAMKEVHAVKAIVDSWVEELERLTAGNTSLDSRLTWALDRLQEDVQWTLNESSDILVSGQNYARAMDEMLDAAARRSDASSNSAWGGQPARGGTITLSSADTAPVLEAGDSICAHSETLSRHVDGIQEQLKTFAELLKETRTERIAQRKEQEKSGWEGFLWNLLYVGLRFIAKAMSTCSKAASGTKWYGGVVSVILGEGSKLANAAADLCREKDTEEESLQRILHFLEDKIPKEMKRAEDSLTAFQTCHRMLQVDFAIQNGHKVRMNRQDAQKARDEWRLYRQRLQVLANDNAATVASVMVLDQHAHAE